MIKTETRIDMEPYIGQNQVLAGPDWGAKVREEVGMDQYDRMDSVIVLAFPEHVISVNSSFLRGFIRPSIMTLGVEKFTERYKVPGFEDAVNEEIRRTVVYMNRLPPGERAAA